MATSTVITPFNPADERDVPIATQQPDPPVIPIVRDRPPVTASIIPNPAALAATAPKIVSNTINLTAAHAGDVEPYIFGRTICTPKIIAADDSGPYLVLDLLWAGHEVQEIEYLIYSNVNEGLGTQLGHNQHFTGAAGQVASSIMAAAKGGSYDTLAGKAHSVISWRTAFGLDVKAMIKGAKLYDPRNSPATSVYSANPALCLGRIMTDSGYTMDWDSVANAANYCDELIGSPQEKRWEVGLQISERQSLQHWVQTFATYSNCFVEIVGSSVFMVPDKPRASNHTVTASNMVAGSVKVIRAGSRNVPERVTVSYTDITETGSPTWEVSAQSRTAETTTDSNIGATTTLHLPGIQSYSRAARLATMTYNKAHNDTVIEFTSFDEGINRTLGDLGTITNSEYGLTSESMALIENRQIERGRWKRKYLDYDASNYSDALFTEPTINTTSLSNPNAPPAGPTPTLSEELYTDADGVTYSRLKVVFTGVAWAYLQDYYITAVGAENTVIDTFEDRAGTGIHTVYSGPLTSGTTYTVNIYLHSNTDAYSANPGTADYTSSAGNSAMLYEGELTNMHTYVVDGVARYATTSQKTGSPQQGQTWADRFGGSPQGTWSAGETWLGNQTCETTFQTEVWDSAQTWAGGWKFTPLNIQSLNGATKAHSVSLSEDTSPLAFVDYSGTLKSAEARYMKAKTVVADSPLSAGDGLHVRLPIPVSFNLGS